MSLKELQSFTNQKSFKHFMTFTVHISGKRAKYTHSKQRAVDTFVKQMTHKCLPTTPLHIQHILMQPIYWDYLIFSAGLQFLVI